MKWSLKDKVPLNSYKVFSVFSGAGGSSMGYKLAGYDVLGCVDSDIKQLTAYRHNLKPTYNYYMDIKSFNANITLPEELYNIDILDASPPCTLFSAANIKADDKKGLNTYYKEGDIIQVLDTLMLDTLDTIKKINPKIMIMENVKGLTFKKNKPYIDALIRGLNILGYRAEVHLLNAKDVGVPQSRVRVFIIATRLKVPYLTLKPKEPKVALMDIAHDNMGRRPSEQEKYVLKYYQDGDKSLGCIYKREAGVDKCFNIKLVKDTDISPTIRAKDTDILKVDHKFLRFSHKEAAQIQTFPTDYNFLGYNPFYIIGMSVPPYMMKWLSNEIKIQWLDYIEIEEVA